MEIVIKEVDTQCDSYIYFVNDDENKYLFISYNDLNLSYDEVKNQIRNYIKDRIELKHRFKNLKSGQKFFGLEKDYPDIKYYSNYFDNFTEYSQDSFGLIELTEDNMADYLHLIM